MKVRAEPVFICPNPGCYLFERPQEGEVDGAGWQRCEKCGAVLTGPWRGEKTESPR